MRRKIFTIFLCIIMITLSLGAMGKNLVSKKIDNHIINDPETEEIEIVGCRCRVKDILGNPDPIELTSGKGWVEVWGYPNDDTPLTTYAYEYYGLDWDKDRHAWRYRLRFDWYHTKHGAYYGDSGWDEWPCVVLQVDLSISEQNTVPGSLNDFAHAGWNVHEGNSKSYQYQQLGELLCSTLVSFIPYVGLAFSTGLQLASALYDAPPKPLYTWQGQQVFQGNGYFHLDFYVYPDVTAEVRSKIDVWCSSVDRGYVSYPMTWILTAPAPSENYAPDKPNPPSGPSSGKGGSRYTYYGYVNDPNTDDYVYVQFDWGDGRDSGWIGPVPEGSQVSASHVWDEGTYNLKVRGKDEWDYIGPWSNSKSITMPKSRPILNQRVLNIINPLFKIYYYLKII